MLDFDALSEEEPMWNTALLSKISLVPHIQAFMASVLATIHSLCEQATANSSGIQIVLQKLQFQEKIFECSTWRVAVMIQINTFVKQQVVPLLSLW